MQPPGGVPGFRHPARTRAGRHQATPRRGGSPPVARPRLRRDPRALPPRKPQISPPVLIAAMPSDRRWLPPPPLRPDRPRRPTLPRTRHHRQSTHGHRATLRLPPPARPRIQAAHRPRIVHRFQPAPRVVAPRAQAPRVVAPRVVAARVVAARVVAPRAQAPRVVALRVVALRVVAPRAQAPRVVAPRVVAPQSAGRSNQNPPTTAGLQRPVTREWKSLRGLRPALPERQARSAAPKWTEEVTNPDLAPVRLWSLRPLAAPPQTRFPEGGRSVGPWQPLRRSKLCRVQGPRRAPQRSAVRPCWERRHSRMRRSGRRVLRTRRCRRQGDGEGEAASAWSRSNLMPSFSAVASTSNVPLDAEGDPVVSPGVVLDRLAAHTTPAEVAASTRQAN